MRNDATTNLFLATCGFILVICSSLLILFAGCYGGGEDDGSDCAATECPDAGPMMADADPATPDSGSPDMEQNSDPCADYYWMEESWWDCNNNLAHCTIDALPSPEDSTICTIKCEEAFWLEVSDLVIQMGTSPAEPAGTLYWSYTGAPPWGIVCQQQRT
jgi:hypothetical protein